MSIALRPSPFHVRMALHNHDNAWTARGAYTVPARFGDPSHEVLAARFSCVLADFSAFEDMRVKGAGAAELFATACGGAVRAMAAGEARQVHWCAEGGGLRGFGTLLRESEDVFLLRAEDTDIGWFAPHATRFGVIISECEAGRGLLLLAGLSAPSLLAAAGLEQAGPLAAHRHIRHDWHGIPVTLGRYARMNGFLVGCAADDGVLVFERLMRAGKSAGLRLAGQEALELMHLEAGLVLPHLDFSPARDDFAREPLPSSLGIGAPSPTSRVLAGVEFDGEEPYPFAPLFHEGNEAGRTLRSAYSLALRRAIALAQLDPKCAAPGTVLQVGTGDKGSSGQSARVVALPFL